MADTLVPLVLPPGIYRNGTVYQSKGRWYDANLVRFNQKTIGPVGGWRYMQAANGDSLGELFGVPRGVHPWRGELADRFLGVGTTDKLYLLAAGALSDITPVGFVASAVIDTIPDPSTPSGVYGAGAYGAGAFGSASATSVLIEADNWQLDNFGDYLVGTSTSDRKLYIWEGDPLVPARAVGVTTGAGTAAATAGVVVFSVSQAGDMVAGDTITVLGDDYLVATFDGTTGATVTPPSTFAASPFVRSVSGHPASVVGTVVTPEGFLVALGWVASTGAASARGLSWASQRTSSQWAPLITNSAGDFDLTTSGRILCGKRTRAETLLWTDADLHVMTYIGGPFVYKFAQAGDNCGAVSPRATVVVDTMALWMGKHNFYMYDGFVKPIPCEVQDYVFGDFNEAQSFKVWGTSIAEFGEVWWFYPSADSTEANRYVAYNYRENHWTIGKLRRSAGCDAGALTNPVMVSPTGILYEHEVLTHRPGTEGIESGILQEDGDGILSESGATIIEEPSLFGSVDGDLIPYLESGPVQIGEGDRLMALQRLIPDERALGDVAATIYSSMHPTDVELVHGPYTVANETSVRVNARQVRIRLDEAVETNWRVGEIRFGGNPSSRR